jgi:hypothetical protein
MAAVKATLEAALNTEVSSELYKMRSDRPVGRITQNDTGGEMFLNL